MNPEELGDYLGNIDIALLDQVLKGRFPAGNRILDAGCGHGRNLVYLLRQGYDVSAFDSSASATESVQGLLERFQQSPAKVHCETIEECSFPDGAFDVVICNAVLHFARDRNHLETQVQRLWQLLAPGGVFFARLASSIGIEDHIEPAGTPGRYRLGDGTERYLVDRTWLAVRSEKLGGALLEPIKTVNVDNKRAMTTWILQKATSGL